MPADVEVIPAKRGRPGRPKGAESRKSAIIAREESERGVTPIAVLLRTMRHLWSEAAPDGERIENMTLAIQACAIAEKCAPYVHPRLAAIDAQLAGDVKITIESYVEEG